MFLSSVNADARWHVRREKNLVFLSAVILLSLLVSEVAVG